ncbi:hypothetical protein LSCM1_02991 [Leishmania martiniquensis]|uniref:Uncharacterized protein n=1 Tax=Leishmania martiniquensis TaxID=1580590 RepID=A0A836KV01_9TRYP|nr:hypothetical protein LSCM1_02991 [Leishmania martiniquensis]
MLCVRKIVFIDRAEPETLWSSHLKKQWCYGDLIAVRVHDSNEKVLGSTIPALFTPTSEAGHPTVCVSWIDEDPVEEPMEAQTAPAASLAGGSRDEVSANESEPVEATASTVTPVSTMDDCAQHASPSGGVAAGAELSPTSNPPQPELAAGGAAGGDRTVTSDKPSAVASKTATGATAGPAVLLSSSAALAGSLWSEGPTGEVSGDARVSAPVAPVARKPSFSGCTPISISGAPKGELHFQVITALGAKVAVAEANVHSILKDDASESPNVQHYAVLITSVNANAEGASAIYAVLEFSVVIGTRDIAKVASLAASASSAPMPTPLLAGSSCAFSTHTFYFPSQFLDGKGVYVVTNVLCVESCTNNSVSLEVALPEGLRRMHVLPQKKAVLQKRGDRAYFTCTWAVLSPYVDTASGKNGDSKSASPGFHVLIREGNENRAPVDIELVGELPPAKAEGVGPYVFFVNHAKITNTSCNAGDMGVLMDILPISLVTRAGA